MTVIKVLGTGCPTCRRLLHDVQQLVAANQWSAKVEYITDLEAILAHGVMRTPALVVNDSVVATGHPGPRKLSEILAKALGA